MPETPLHISISAEEQERLRKIASRCEQAAGYWAEHLYADNAVNLQAEADLIRSVIRRAASPTDLEKRVREILTEFAGVILAKDLTDDDLDRATAAILAALKGTP